MATAHTAEKEREVPVSGLGVFAVPGAEDVLMPDQQKRSAKEAADIAVRTPERAASKPRGAAPTRPPPAPIRSCLRHQSQF